MLWWWWWCVHPVSVCVCACKCAHVYTHFNSDSTIRGIENSNWTDTLWFSKTSFHSSSPKLHGYLILQPFANENGGSERMFLVHQGSQGLWCPWGTKRSGPSSKNRQMLSPLLKPEIVSGFCPAPISHPKSSHQSRCWGGRGEPHSFIYSPYCRSPIKNTSAWVHYIAFLVFQ